MFQLSGVDNWLMKPQGEKMNVLLRGTSGRSCAVVVVGTMVRTSAPAARPMASFRDIECLRAPWLPPSERALAAPIPMLGLLLMLVRRLDIAAVTLQSF